MSQETIPAPAFTKADFDSGLDVRWCPGCGDYSILANVQKLLPTLGVGPERYVFVSGIGCSSRFPYYVNTYGFHSIHGRAPAIATGVKLTNPELKVWIVTGDGDAMGIGGNHLIHLLRRNVNTVVLMFNNRIYGLTKGQSSPTSEIGKVTKSTPHGSSQHPFNPLLLALGAQGSFVARALDSDAPGLAKVLKEASDHQGTAFIEILQNCRIFNDGAFEYVKDREVKFENQIELEHGKPLLFGKNKEKGIRIRDFKAEVVPVDPGDAASIEKNGIAVYDKTNVNMAQMIASFEHPELPIAMGIVYQHQRATFEDIFANYGESQRTAESKDEFLNKLFHSGETWVES